MAELIAGVTSVLIWPSALASPIRLAYSPGSCWRRG